MEAEVKARKSSCLNCGMGIKGNYCHQCGQVASPGRITFSDTFRQFLSASFALQGPLLSTIRLLMVNPGRLFRDFIHGKRKSYYQPVSFFVLLTAVYIIIRLMIEFDPLAAQAQAMNNEHVQLNEIQQNLNLASKYMVKNINYIMFFLVFAIGLMLKLFFRKRYNLAEYISIGFYISGIYIIAGIIVMVISKYSSHYLTPLQLCFLVLYIVYCCASLFGKINIWLTVKYLLVGSFSLLLYIILGFGFSFLIVSL